MRAARHSVRLVLAAWVWVAAAPAQERASGPPNIVLYVVDDQGTGDAGAYGHPVIKTPGLDRLAREGTRFTHAFCTTSSCSSSRSVMLTGLHNHANGMYGLAHRGFQSRGDVVSLSARLSKVGYRTLSAGKYHVAPRDVYPFDEFAGRGAPAELAERCGAWIRKEDARPFFVYLGTNEPHRPFRRGGSDPVAPEDVVVPPYLPDTPECREELAHYAMSVQRADRGLVRLLEILDETGHAGDTLVVYVSDNGIAFPGAKTTLYEPGMRLPCVVRAPGQTRRGIACDAMITWADLTPTMLDFAGALPEKPVLHGRSFRAVVETERTEGWDEVYASHTFHEATMYYPMRVVRGRRYKLIWNLAWQLEYPFASDLWRSKTWQGVLRRGDERYGQRSVQAFLHRPEFELYDLEEDPHEIRNLAGEPASAAVLAELKAKLQEFQRRTKDPWVLKWKRQ